MNTNNWIPVKKELPKAETRVLILFERKIYNGEIYQDVLCGFYEDGTVWREDSKTAWDIDMCMEYDEKRDDYRIPKGWYEELANRIDEYNVVAIDDRVTHWMPLPKPPTETGGKP